MSTSSRTILIGIFILSTVGVLQSGDQADVRAIIDKAIKAQGGADKIAKYPASTFKISGTFYGLGEGIPYTGEWAVQGPKQIRFVIESKVMDVTFKFTRVVNGDKGWVKINDDVTSDMAKDELDEEKAKLYAGWVQSLLPLKDKSFELSLVGEAKVMDKPAIGIRVSKKGQRDVNLYFDKATSLMVKSELRTKDVMVGQEYTQVTYFQDYKDFQGVKRATKILQHKDDKRLVEGVITETRPMEKLEDSVFAKP